MVVALSLLFCKAHTAACIHTGSIDTLATQGICMNASSFPQGRIASLMVTALALGMAGFHVYALGFSLLDPWLMNMLHFQFVTALALLTTTWRGKAEAHFSWSNGLLMLASLAYGAYIILFYDDLSMRLGTYCEDYDLAFSLLALTLVFELIRREAGLPLAALTAAFVLYCFVGPWMPELLWHKGYSADRVFPYFFGTSGIFNVPMSVASRFVYIFVLFGALLEVAGVGAWFMGVARAAAGRSCGGAAKVAVISSCLMGMLSGTAVGNVVTTGSLTIPLMKKHGYTPYFAGAVEACASTGGQIMPPVMGAAVFLLAQMVGRPYDEIMVAAILPALLFYAGLFFMVDVEARRMGLRQQDAGGIPLRRLLAQSYLSIPLFLLAGLIIAGYSVVYAGLCSIAALLLTACVHSRELGGPCFPLTRMVQGIRAGGLGIVQISVTCAAAGIIMGAFALTGLGLKMASIVLTFAQGSAPVALFLTMTVTVILGMGLPTIAAYAICASVLAPALIKMGIPELPAHLFILYFASFSAITPPVALASYAAAAIAKTPPMRLSLEAVRIGLPAFIIPYMFVYGPELLLQGDALSIAASAASALLGVCCLGAAIIGHGRAPLRLWERLCLLASSLLLINPGLLTDGLGLLLGLAVCAGQCRPRRTTP